MPPINWFVEGERRGLLTPDDAAWLAEARRRGLAPPSSAAEPPIPMNPIAAMGQQFGQATEKLGKALTLEGAVLPTLTGKGMLAEPASNFGLGIMQAFNAPFIGAGRAVGTTVQDIAQPILRKIVPYEEGATESAAYLGAVADAAAQLGIPFLTSKAVQLVKPFIKGRYPLRAPQLAELEAQKTGAVQRATETATQETQNALALKKAGEQQAIGQLDVASGTAAQDIRNALALKKAGEQEAIGELEKIKGRAGTAREMFQAEQRQAESEARTAAQLIQESTKQSTERAISAKTESGQKYGEVGARQFLTQEFPGAPTAGEAGGQFAREIFPQQKARAAQRFTTAYNELFSQADQVSVLPSDTERAIGRILKEAGPAAPALPTQAESFGGRLLGTLGKEAVGNEGEAVAVEIRRALNEGNPLRADEQVYSRILDRLKNPQGAGGVPTSISVEMLKEALETQRLGEQTAGDLMRATLRIRAAGRAAQDAGKSNIARQFGEIETGLLADIKTAGSQLKSDFDSLSGAYRRDYVTSYSYGSPMAKAIEKFPEDVHQLVPAIIRPANDKQAVAAIKSAWGVVKTPEERAAITGSWLRGYIDNAVDKGLEIGRELPKVWDAHLDPRNGNYVLKSAFGDRFEPVNRFMQSLKQAREMDFAGVADEAVTNLLRNRTTSLKAIEDAQKARLSPFAEVAAKGETAATRAGLKTQAALNQLQKQTAQEVAGIQAATEQQSKGIADTLRQLQAGTEKEVGQIGTARDKLIGQIQKDYEDSVARITPKPWTGQRLEHYAFFHGALGIVQTMSGSPWGVRNIAGAGILYVSAPMIAKMVNTARGVELLTRLARAAPGTVQAISVGSQIESFARNLAPDLPQRLEMNQ